jgi:hypothetical protein
MRFLVIIDGAGEFDDNYSVHTFTGATAQDAVDAAVADGYGKERAFVVPFEYVLPFALGEHRKTVADLVTFEEVIARMPRGVRQFIEPDNPAHKIPEIPRVRRATRDVPQ